MIMKKNVMSCFLVLSMCLVLRGKGFSMSCHSGDDEGGHSLGKQEEESHSKHAEKAPAREKISIKESFYGTIYTCPMHPDVKMDKSGKCPECGMKLEKKEILMTYACPEEKCDYQKAKAGECPEHKKELEKTEIKDHCPDCGRQVDKEKLVQKPVKKNK